MNEREPERDAFGNPVSSDAAQTTPSVEPSPVDEPPRTDWPPPQAPAEAPSPTMPPPPPPPPEAFASQGGASAPLAPPPPPPPIAPAPFGPGIAFSGQALASWGSRAAAFLLDGFLVALTFVPGIVLLATGSEGGGVTLFVAALVWAYFLYAPLFMMRSGDHNGQTPGKQLLGVRVVREGGEPTSFGFALMRELGVKTLLIGVGGSLFFLLPTLLDYLWPLWDDENRALHDHLVSTRVVETG